VVPFGFFVNEGVKAKTCTAGLVGNYCADTTHVDAVSGLTVVDIPANTHCNTGPSTTDGVCGAAATITNVSREEISLIFSGVATDWSDLGAYFEAKPIVACLRHAGSGTAAAFEHTVMNSAWGANLVASEVPGNIYFNQDSGGMMKCINGNTGGSTTGAVMGGIGYADADQAINAAGSSDHVKQLKYNGFYPTRSAVRNGLYDFYTNAWLYTNPANTVQADLAADIIAFAQLPGNVPSNKKNYWATVGEMKFNRVEDKGYPALAFPSDPMLP
jgi:ABC-type phosphate transport system substrate-binding protein